MQLQQIPYIQQTVCLKTFGNEVHQDGFQQTANKIATKLFQQLCGQGHHLTFAEAWVFICFISTFHCFFPLYSILKFNLNSAKESQKRQLQYVQ